MSRRSPIFYTESQRALMWERWRAGDSLEQISQMFDRHHSSVRRILGETGGIRPAERRRGAKALTVDQTRSQAAPGTLQVPDLGPRQGDGRPQALHAGHGHQGLLLRSAEPLATRIQREHQWTVAAVPPQGHRPLGLFAGKTQRLRQTLERAAAENTELPNPSRTI